MLLLIKNQKFKCRVDKAAIWEMVLKFWKDPNLKNGLEHGLKKLVLIPSVSVWVNTLPKKKKKKIANIFIAVLYLCMYP